MKKLLFTIIWIVSFAAHAQINGKFMLSSTDIQIYPNGDFSEISFPQSIAMDEIGSPQLPYVTRTYVLPVDAKIEGISINSSVKHKIAGIYNIYPAQPPIPSSLKDPYNPPFAYNEALYRSSAPFTGERVKILYEGFDQGYHLVTIGIYPLEYIPSKKEIYLYPNLDYTINFTLVPQTRSNSISTKQTEENANELESMFKAIVTNPSDVLKYRPSSTIFRLQKNISKTTETVPEANTRFAVLEELVPKYIIITNKDLEPVLKRLADWKTRKGVPAIIKTTEDISAHYPGSDLPEKIRNYIIEAGTKWGKGLYILLAGNYSIIPPKDFNSVAYGDKVRVPVDLYYSTINGSWNSSDPSPFLPKDWTETTKNEYIVNSFQGRAPIKNKVEAEIFVGKVLSYEKAEVADKSYYNNVLVYDAFMSGGGNTVSNIAKTALKENITYPLNLKNWFIFDDHNCDDNSRYLYKASYWGEWCGSPTCTKGDQELNSKNVLDALNKWNSADNYFHIVYNMDHGHQTALGTSSIDKGQNITREDVRRLKNGKYQQIFMTGSCNTAQFNVDCFAEGYLNNPIGGGVAYLGNSDNGYIYETWQFKIFMDALNNKSTPYSMGCLFRQVQSRDEVGSIQGSNRKMVLLGDPEMQVWTNTPQELSVNANASVASTGETRVSVKINTPLSEEATVCIMKGSDAYLVEKIKDTIEHNYLIDSHTSDSIYVTVTAHNYIPKIKPLADPINYATNLSISQLVFNDALSSSLGNGNGIAEAGETMELNITLKNTGHSTARNVSAILSCNSTYITILKSDAEAGNIVSGSEKELNIGRYKIKIDKDTPEKLRNDLSPITFNLQIKDADNTSYAVQKFNVDVFAWKLEQRNKIIINPVGTITADQTVDLKVDLFNEGKATAMGLQGTLESNSQYASILSGTSSFPEIKSKEVKNNSTTFRFKISSSYNVGQKLDFTLKLKDKYGKEANMNFDLDRYQPPLASNFTSTDNQIRVNWDKVVAANNKIGYNIYKCNSQDGIYKRLNTYTLENSYFVDYEVDALSKYYYKVTSVSESGNEGQLSTALPAWTTPPSVGLFPITMNLSIVNPACIPINVCDINYNDSIEIVTGMGGGDNTREGYLAVFNAEGREFLNTDNNVTTNSEFAKLKGTIRAGVAIGDIFGIGETNIISVTRTTTETINYLTCHSTTERNGLYPKVIWEKEFSGEWIYSAPTIANIDNSSDGTMEIITYSDGGQLTVRDCYGEILWAKDDLAWNVAGVAVGDLNNDGYKEIVCASTTKGLIIYNYKGAVVGKLTLDQVGFDNGEVLRSEPVIFDPQGNGKKVILLRTVNQINNKSRVFVWDFLNGSLFLNWGILDDQLFSIKDDASKFGLGATVGDINNDGSLEVVACGKNLLRVWKYNGDFLFEKTVEKLHQQQTPLIADVDGDGLSDIVVYAESFIYAYNMHGDLLKGFPLKTDNTIQSLAIADLDKNGKSELIAVNYLTVSAWETNGDPSRIEWGMARFDAQNTGEKKTICKPRVIKKDVTLYGETLCEDIIIEDGGKCTIMRSTSTLDNDAQIIVKKEEH